MGHNYSEQVHSRFITVDSPDGPFRLFDLREDAPQEEYDWLMLGATDGAYIKGELPASSRMRRWGLTTAAVLVPPKNTPDRGRDKEARREARELSPGLFANAKELGEHGRRLLLDAESNCERRSRKQFVRMLFTEEGNVRVGGYERLVALKKPLQEKHSAVFLGVLNAARRVERDRRSSKGIISLKRAVADYFDWLERRNMLSKVLRRFEVSGRPPTLWEFLRESKEEREEEKSGGVFETQLQAIRTVVTDPEQFNGLRFNSELYERAAEVTDLRYQDPQDAFRKSMSRNFEPRFEEEPPDDPQEWKAFFPNGHAPESGQRTGHE